MRQDLWFAAVKINAHESIIDWMLTDLLYRSSNKNPYKNL